MTLPAPAAAARITRRTRQLEARRLAGGRWRDWGLAFAPTTGAPLEPTNATPRFQRPRESTGLPRRRFHALRPGAASLLLAGNVAPRTIMGILGHSQIGPTINTCAHPSPALERDAAAVLDAVLGAEAG